jgi:hypothetical protein
MCFIGHGAFGIITKSIWCNYFALFGLGHDTAFTLMPLVGAFDILMGIIILVYPLQLVVSWLVVWGVFTASLRPLSGEPFAELIERAGNYGAPLALLILSGGFSLNFKKLFAPLTINIHNEERLSAVANGLRIVVFLLFAGHGWLNIIEKKSIVDQYLMLGFTNPATVAQMVGMFEIIAAFIVLVHPVKYFVLILFIWKISSELFYPHYEIFEWIERGGSYGAPLALYFSLHETALFKKRLFKTIYSAAKSSSSDYNIN